MPSLMSTKKIGNSTNHMIHPVDRKYILTKIKQIGYF